MTAVALGEAETRALLEQLNLNGPLVIAGVNSFRGITLAGDSRRLAEIETALEKQKVRYKRLDLDYAFHSPAMDPIQPVIKKSPCISSTCKRECSFFQQSREPGLMVTPSPLTTGGKTSGTRSFSNSHESHFRQRRYSFHRDRPP